MSIAQEATTRYRPPELPAGEVPTAIAFITGHIQESLGSNGANAFSLLKRALREGDTLTYAPVDPNGVLTRKIEITRRAGYVFTSFFMDVRSKGKMEATLCERDGATGASDPDWKPKPISGLHFTVGGQRYEGQKAFDKMRGVFPISRILVPGIQQPDGTFETIPSDR